MATTPPSPVSSWTVEGPAASDGAHPAPVLVWPSSTKSLTVHDPSRGGALHLKLAQENETLQIWLEESASKRQFYKSLTNEECKAIVKGVLDPSNLLEMLKLALLATGEAGEELSASFEWGPSQVTLILHLHHTWVAKAFHFPLEERDVGQVDRLERRMDDMLEKQAEHGAKIKECVDALKADAVDTYGKQEIDQQLAGKANVQQLDGKADVADTYRKQEIDQQLAGKADVLQLAGKADAADTYRKQEIDQQLAGKADVQQLAGKADAADTYRKQEIDQQLADKADVQQLAGKADVQQLAGKADAADTYRKQEIDQLMARRDEEAKRAELSCWSLHVGNPYQYNEGYNGHFAMSGNHFLIQDVDHTAKKTGVITNTGSAGFIQATFPKPVHVRTVKIAALHKSFGTISPSGGTVTLSVQSPETGEFETLRQDIPGSTKEEVFPVDKTILALRLSGTWLCISKLIFS